MSHKGKRKTTITRIGYAPTGDSNGGRSYQPKKKRSRPMSDAELRLVKAMVERMRAR